MSLDSPIQECPIISQKFGTSARPNISSWPRVARPRHQYSGVFKTKLKAFSNGPKKIHFIFFFKWRQNDLRSDQKITKNKMIL
jgi:hypothetical protein